MWSRIDARVEARKRKLKELPESVGKSHIQSEPGNVQPSELKAHNNDFHKGWAVNGCVTPPEFGTMPEAVKKQFQTLMNDMDALKRKHEHLHKEQKALRAKNTSLEGLVKSFRAKSQGKILGGPTMEQWNSLRNLRDTSNDLHRRIMSITSNRCLADSSFEHETELRQLRKPCQHASQFPNCGIVVFNNLLAGQKPTTFKEVLAFVCLSSAMSSAMEMTAGSDHMANFISSLTKWRLAIHDQDDRAAFDELTYSLWPDVSSSSNTFNSCSTLAQQYLYNQSNTIGAGSWAQGLDVNDYGNLDLEGCFQEPVENFMSRSAASDDIRWSDFLNVIDEASGDLFHAETGFGQQDYNNIPYESHSSSFSGGSDPVSDLRSWPDGLISVLYESAVFQTVLLFMRGKLAKLKAFKLLILAQLLAR